VCDDKEYSRRAKSFHQKAIMMQVPAITTTGIYPGVSNSGFLQSDTYSRISMSSWFLNLEADHISQELTSYPRAKHTWLKTWQ
jgi:hypothetical protein